jgi:hypothetical protein
VVVRDPIVKHVFVVALDKYVKRKVVVVGPFKVLDECCVHINPTLLGHTLVVSEDLFLVELVKVYVL